MRVVQCTYSKVSKIAFIQQSLYVLIGKMTRRSDHRFHFQPCVYNNKNSQSWLCVQLLHPRYWSVLNTSVSSDLILTLMSDDLRGSRLTFKIVWVGREYTWFSVSSICTLESEVCLLSHITSVLWLYDSDDWWPVLSQIVKIGQIPNIFGFWEMLRIPNIFSFLKWSNTK